MTLFPGAASASTHPWGDEATPYEQLGGETVLKDLVDHFYDLMNAESPALRAMHPVDDGTSRRNLREFLSGWMGGPNLYRERRGEPMLRMRHLPFSIGQVEATEWMRCMRGAFEELAVQEPLRGYLETRLEQTAQHMRNSDRG